MASIHMKPWDKPGEVIDDSIYIPKGMIGPEERRCYYWLGKNVLSGAGCIVDAGAFVGASTYCFAAGAAAGGRRQYRDGPLIHAYDFFKVIDDYVGATITKEIRPILAGESYLDIFKAQTAQYSDLIEPHPGNFLSAKWNKQPIEILFIDIAKTEELNSHVIGEFFPYLVAGKAVLVQQDYFHCWHPYIHISMEFLDSEFELVDEHIKFQSRAWILKDPIPDEKLQRVRARDFTKQERLALLDRLISKSSQSFRPMIEVVRIWQIFLDGDFDKASSEMKVFRSIHSIDNLNVLWARQALEVESLIAHRVK